MTEATKFLVNPSFTFIGNFDLLQQAKIWLHRCNPREYEAVHGGWLHGGYSHQPAARGSVW